MEINEVEKAISNYNVEAGCQTKEEQNETAMMEKVDLESAQIEAHIKERTSRSRR